MRAASLTLQALADAEVESNAPVAVKVWPMDISSLPQRMALLNAQLDALSHCSADAFERYHRHSAVCEQQRAAVLEVMKAMQALVMGVGDKMKPPSYAKGGLSLTALRELSQLWLTFAKVLEQHRAAQQLHSTLRLLHRHLTTLPCLLKAEEQRIYRWLQSIPSLLPLLPAWGCVTSFSAAVYHLSHTLQSQAAEISRLRLLSAESHRVMKRWMRSHSPSTSYPCALPHPPLPVVELPSYSPLLPSLFSLAVGLLQSHSLSKLSCAAALPSSVAFHPTLDLLPLFALLTRGSRFALSVTVDSLACLPRCPATPSSPISPPFVTAAALVHSTFLELARYRYHSCHITHNPSNPSHPLHLHSLPRTSPLLLGHLPSPFPAPPTNPKSENQLHTLPFTHHPLLQSIDMNQSCTFEDALKAPLYYTSLQQRPGGGGRFVLGGCAEWIYSSSISAVGGFMAYQDTSFVTVCARVLSYTGVRLHYGHPDVFDGGWVRGHVGLSKGSAGLNLSEDLFFGLDMIERGEMSDYSPWMRYGKGREVSLSNCAIFEDKLSRGAALTLKSYDLHRLRASLDPLTSMSLLYGGIAHFLFTAIFNYGVVSFCYIVLLMVMARVTSEAIGLLGSVYAIPWIFHLGFLFAAPLLAHQLYSEGLWYGLYLWVNHLTLGSLYYLFQLRTKGRGMEIGLGGVASGYVSTGRGMGLRGVRLVGLYTTYASSHYTHAMDLLVLMGIYAGVALEGWGSIALRVWAVMLATVSWIIAPALFNPVMHWRAGSKMGEWMELKGWTRGTSLTCPSGPGVGDWEGWWWGCKRGSLLQQAARFHVTSRCGWRRWMHHPVVCGIGGVWGCVVGQCPLLLVGMWLVGSALDLVAMIVGYGLVLAVVGRVAPRHFVWPVMMVMVGYTVWLIMDGWRGVDWVLPLGWLVGVTRVGEAVGVMMGLGLAGLVVGRVGVAVVDGVWVWRIYQGQDMREVPAAYKRVMDGWGIWWVWERWERWFCPMTVGLVQLVCGMLCEWGRVGHSRWMYSVNLPRLQAARQRRASP